MVQVLQEIPYNEGEMMVNWKSLRGRPKKFKSKIG